MTKVNNFEDSAESTHILNETGRPTQSATSTANEGLNAPIRKTVNSNNGIMNRFALGNTNAQALVIEALNKVITDYQLNATVNTVSIGTSAHFKGIAVKYTYNGVQVLLPLVIDERRVKMAAELIDDMMNKKPLIFSSAVINQNPEMFISGFKKLADGATIISPLVLIGENVNRESIEDTVKDIFAMIEAKQFNSIADALHADVSNQLVAEYSSNGTNVKLNVKTVSNLNTNKLVESIYSSGNDTAITVTGKIDLLLGGKEVIKNGVKSVVERLRPVVFINGYDKPETISKYNLEYGLFAIIAGSILTQKDKVFKALLPSNITKLNAGAFNPIMKAVTTDSGESPMIDLLDPKLDINAIISYLLELTTDSSLGINIRYKMDTTSLDEFIESFDAHASTSSRTAAIRKILSAYQNITKTATNPNGLEYNGNLIEKSLTYPIGTYRDMTGVEKNIEDIDALWLATKASQDNDPETAYKLAIKWILADTQNDPFQSKLEVLAELSNSTETKVSGVGYKVILHPEFINSLIKNSGIIITSNEVLAVNDAIGATTFGGVNIGITRGIDNAGRSNIIGGNNMQAIW